LFSNAVMDPIKM